MATKLDQDFVAHIKKSHANSLAGINALVSEVERLEAQVEALETKLGAMTLIADDHAIARLKKTEQIAELQTALKKAGDVLYNVQCKAPGYDWNADPLSLTLANGDVFESVKKFT